MYPQKRNVELTAPIIVGYPRESSASRGRHFARTARKHGKVPLVLQGEGGPETLLTTDVKRLSALMRQGHLSKDKKVQLDVCGDLILCSARLVHLEPVTGEPTALVLCREQGTAESHYSPDKAYPEAVYPLGWVHKTREKS